jgi:hypothetical protein
LIAPDIYALLNIEQINNDGEIVYGIKTGTEKNSALKSVSENVNNKLKHIHARLFKLTGVNVHLLTPDESNRVIDNMAIP